MSRTLQYPRPTGGVHPPNDSPSYRSTALRHPQEPLVIIPHTLSELTGPAYPYGRLQPTDHDLTRQHAGEPLGERIIVEGRVLDEDGRPIPNTLVEIWQANAAGRYAHPADQNPMPIDLNFEGYAKIRTGPDGGYRIKTVKPGAYPVMPGWTRPLHIHFDVKG